MNLSQALTLLTVGIASRLFSSDKLKWSEVQNWISVNANHDNYGRGYAMGKLSQPSGHAYAEVRKEISGGRIHITASITFDPRQGAAVVQSWDAKSIDSEFEKVFGRNLRVRISV
ncbi:MAG: hypothetical protein ABL868_10445 [Sulfuriferula sp.]